MAYPLCWLTSVFTLLVSLVSIPILAQSIDTQPLSVTSICAGSQIDVRANQTNASGSFAVELSPDGVVYSVIPSIPVSISGSTEITYRATIPTNTSAGNSYRIRIVSNNSTVTSSPSSTVLTVKAKPALPKVDSLILDCQYISPSASVYSFIYTEVMPNATSTLYNENLSVQQVIQGTAMIGSISYTSFQISKTAYFSAKYVYPVKDLTFYLTQSVNDCDSDKAKTVVRLLYRPVTGPIPVNAKSVEVPFHLPNTYYGTLAYCQGEKASPLSVNGYAAPPENFMVASRLLPDTQFSTSAITPKTNSPSTQVYEFALQPIDLKKGCANYAQLNTQLAVTVKPTQTAALLGNQIINEGQPASLLVAFSGDFPWNFSYRDSTGTGLGMVQSLTATTNPYTFSVNPKRTTAYVLTSVGNGCGKLSDRVVVTVNPLLGVEDQSLTDAVDVYPIPSTTNLTVRIRGLASTQPAVLELAEMPGRVISRQETRQATSSVSLEHHPAGTYILGIQVGERRAFKRIVKL